VSLTHAKMGVYACPQVLVSIAIVIISHGTVAFANTITIHGLGLDRDLADFHFKTSTEK